MSVARSETGDGMASSAAGGSERDEFEGDENESLLDPAKHLIITSDGQLDKSLLIRTQGWIYKKGGSVNENSFAGGRRNWKKRWFVLEEIPYLGHVGYELQYFDSKNGKLKGTIGLSEVEIHCEPRSRQKKTRYEFQILLQNRNTLNLACDNPVEREEWIITLKYVVAYLAKLSTATVMGIDGYDPTLEDDPNIYELGQELAQNAQVKILDS